MRITTLFGHTLREAPAEARTAAHQLLVRGAFVRPLAPGQFAFLPLGERIRNRLSARILQSLPHAQPLALPPQQAQPERLLAAEIHTYRSLPVLLYQQRTPTHPPRGLLRARHHRALSLWHIALPQNPPPFENLLNELWQTCDLEVRTVEDAQGGRASLFLHPAGEDRLRQCPACGYAATRRAARRRKTPPPTAAPAPLAEVHTPGTQTIADLAAYLGIPASQTAKAVFLQGKTPEGHSRLVFAVLRGDMDLNPDKLARLSGLHDLQPASEEAIRAIGAQPGFASPVGLPADAGCLIVADDLIPRSPNLVAGANRVDTHLRNVNYGRDFRAALLGDLAEARPGDPCPHCGQPLEAQNAVLLAESAAGGSLTCAAEAGGQAQAQIHSLQIDLDAVLACCAQAHHDDYGLLWPAALAPFDVHVLTLPGKKQAGQVQRSAERLYTDLQAAGYAVLLDARPESPGVKFTDADLIGAPWRVTVSARALAKGGVELKARNSRERRLIPPADLLPYLRHDRTDT